MALDSPALISSLSECEAQYRQESSIPAVRCRWSMTLKQEGQEALVSSNLMTLVMLKMPSMTQMARCSLVPIERVFPLPDQDTVQTFHAAS